jgi:phosphoenolpyruvate-protein phosphotransferase
LKCEASLPAVTAETIADNAIDSEIARFDAAVTAVKSALEGNKKRLESAGHANEAAIFDAQALILTDAELLDDVHKAIFYEKHNAAYIYREKMANLAEEYRTADSDYLKERATDVNDVCTQVIEELRASRTRAASNKPDAKDSARDIILFAPEVTPSMLAKYEGRLLGILTSTGGPTSHVAILARTLGIPALSGVRDTDLQDNRPILLDADHRTVTVNPDEKTRKAYETAKAAWEAQKLQDAADSCGPAVTKKCVAIHIRANIGDAKDAKAAAQWNAEGVGLLRTEFLFLASSEEPDEETQVAALREILAFFPDTPVTIRTLDIGGDKPLPWLHLDKEENPFLGVRGVRLYQKVQGLFKTQLRAILRAAHGYHVKIMVPMVAVKSEVEWCKTQKAAVEAELAAEKLPYGEKVPLGIMVETPAAALMAPELATVADFFSIGSNDLTQYTMAAERGNNALADLTQASQPAVLLCIKMAAEAAIAAQIPISVCGEAAGDPAMTKALLALGITELSMTPTSIGRIKRAVRTV